MHYPSFVDLNKFKVSLLHEEASEIENINFAVCYATWLKDGIYAVTKIGVEILMHIQIFIPLKAIFFLKGIQQSSLIIEMMI